MPRFLPGLLLPCVRGWSRAPVCPSRPGRVRSEQMQVTAVPPVIDIYHTRRPSTPALPLAFDIYESFTSMRKTKSSFSSPHPCHEGSSASLGGQQAWCQRSLLCDHLLCRCECDLRFPSGHSPRSRWPPSLLGRRQCADRQSRYLGSDLVVCHDAQRGRGSQQRLVIVNTPVPSQSL